MIFEMDLGPCVLTNTSARVTKSSLVLLAVSCVIGCSGRPTGPDYSVLEMAQVSGRVTMNGEPLVGVRVEFVEAKRRPPRLCFGETDSNGYYKLYRDRKVPGCLHGEMIVKITAGRKSDEATAGQTAIQIPAKYNYKSELFRTVEPNGSHTFDFEL